MAGLGDYEMQRQIGAGTSGTVWRAVRTGPVAQVVAVKRLHAGAGASAGGADADDAVARLRAEAAVLAELDHPHIVRVLEIVVDGDANIDEANGDHPAGGVAICMAHAAGGSLQALLARHGRLAPGEVVAVAVPLAEALASAHRRGIVHGDVKPANILFTSDGEPLLGDFGVAHILGRSSRQVGGVPDASAAGDAGQQAGPGEPGRADGPGVVVGSAPYLAPELLEGAEPGARSDVYALGVVCYEALTGRLPYDGPTPDAVVDAARAGEHEPLTARPSISGTLAAIVEQAMARDPERRPASADLLARALRASLPPEDIRLPRITVTDGPADQQEAVHPLPPAGPSRPDAPSRPPGGSGGDVRGTRTFGPRPPRPEPPAPRRRRRLPVGLALALLAAGLVYLVRGPLRDDPECPAVQEPVADALAQVVAGDPEGDGCETYGIYQLRTLAGGEQAMVLTIPVDGERRSIRLGEAGDQLFLGDWDCDGTDTPGLYRRARGELQRFDAWPEVEGREQPPQTTEAAPPNGRASLQPSAAAQGGAGNPQSSGTGGAGPGVDGGSDGPDLGCDRIVVHAGTAT